MNLRRMFLGAWLCAPALWAQRGAVRLIHRQKLPAPFTGLDAAILEVTIPPGPSAPAHRHSGFVLGYVIEGEFSFAVDGQAPRTIPAGQVFYEPPGGVHSTSASASAQKGAKILAIIIGEEGKELTTYVG